MKFSETDQLKQARILNKIIKAANDADSLSFLLNKILNSTIELTNFDGGGIYLIDDDTRTAQIQYQIGLPQNFLTIFKTIDIDDPRYSPVFISGAPIFAEDLSKKNPNMAETSGFESIMSIPLFSKEKIIGAMNIGSKNRRVISQFERDVFQYLSREIGTVISKIQAEESLKESEKKYKIVTDNINDIIWTMDLNFKSTYVSPSTTSILGYTPEEDMAMSLQEKFTPESLIKIGKMIRKYISPKTINDPNFNPSFTIELEQYHKNGSIIPTEVKVNPMRDENGIAFGLAGITRDISSRKRAEYELKASEEKYRNLYNNATVGLLQTRVSDGKIIASNQKSAEMIGYDDVQQFMDEYIVAEHYVDPSARLKMIEEIKKTGDVRNFEIEITNRFGVHRWGSFSIHLNPEKGTLDSVIIDITERKIAEQKLKESEDNFRAIAENANDSIMIAKGKGELVYVNERASNLMGYRIDELLNLTIVQLLHPSEIEKVMERYKKRMEDKPVPPTYEIIMLRKDGISINVEVNMALTKWQGQPADLAIVRDITERKKAERELKESENRYREAFNRAEFYKDLFTHDMNNILQSIQLSAEYFKLFKDDGVQLEKIDDIASTIKTQAKRGAKLISNIRKLSSLEDTEILLKPSLISEHLNNSIKNIINDFQNLNIEIDVKKLKDHISILGDDLLVDIFDNILNNAVKFTHDKDTILIEITIEKTILDGIPFVKLEFKDHGMGIKDERKEKIFQRSHIEEYDGQGMGMGLSLVRKIVERYGGFIKVEDRVKGEYQKGSNFILLFKEA